MGASRRAGLVRCTACRWSTRSSWSTPGRRDLCDFDAQLAVGLLGPVRTDPTGLVQPLAGEHAGRRAPSVPELRRLGVRVVLATLGTSDLPVDELVCPLEGPRFVSITAPYNRVSGIAHARMQGVVLRLRSDIDVVHDHLEVVGPAVLAAAIGPAAPPSPQALHWDLRKHADCYTSFDGGGRVRFRGRAGRTRGRLPTGDGL